MGISPDRLTGSNDVRPSMTMHPSSTPRARRLLLTMQASLAALMAVSLSFVFVSVVPAGREVSGFPPGIALAVVKLIALGIVLRRVRDTNVYSMQWSSMFILLFIAEGTVRASSDPQPGALLGLAESVVAAIYFAAVLMFLRPLKKQARADRASS
jgi:uncharacterized membrane protein